MYTLIDVKYTHTVWNVKTISFKTNEPENVFQFQKNSYKPRYTSGCENIEKSSCLNGTFNKMTKQFKFKWPE